MQYGVLVLGILSALLSNEAIANLDDDSRALLGLAAMKCSVLANRSGQVDEEKRLFELALAIGREIAPGQMQRNRKSDNEHLRYVGEHL
jgi:hypothetical protein